MITRLRLNLYTFAKPMGLLLGVLQISTFSLIWTTSTALAWERSPIPAASLASTIALPAPVQGQLSSPYGWRVDPITGKSRFHSGLDIAAPTGSPIFALQPGWVVFSGPYAGYGNLLVIQHTEGVHTWYGHTATLLRQVGEWVNPGDIIALVGSTGRATGPHLHFEVRYQGQVVDPALYLSNLNMQENPRLPGPVAWQASKVRAQSSTTAAGLKVPLPTKENNSISAATPLQALTKRHEPSQPWKIQLVNGSQTEERIFVTAPIPVD